ncbi:MAG: hypothetical protein J7L22_03645 [Candidatus Marinimicrobia bacterium]|nr:hypothetical protein [Candidatus Neomarinimicrobiota bacterium]
MHIRNYFYTDRKKYFPFVALLLFGLTAINARTPGFYTRKSISHTTVVLSLGDIKLSAQEEFLFNDALNTGLHIPRFDYNPLPENVQTSFRRKLSSLHNITEQNLADEINEALVPEILKILDIYKEIRARKLVSDAQRNSFISLKAKEAGITAQQLEAVMNSSYIYIPFISKYSVEKNEDKKEITVSLSGGVIWFQVVSGENPRVEKITTLHTDTYFSAKTDDRYNVNGRHLSAGEYAFWGAANTMAMNLEIQTRELDMFRLTAPITEIHRRKISFPLGTAEGIRLDEPFFVGEWVETPSGKIKFKKSGFVRVSTVSDNKSSDGQPSQAIAIKKGDWVRGMMIKEHPRLGIDIAVRPRWFEVNVESGIMASAKELFAVYFENYDSWTLGLDMNFQWNIANLTKKRQSFLVFGGTVSAIPVKSVIFDYNFLSEDYSWLDLFPVRNWAAGLFYGYAGYMRRFYLGPFAIHGEASLGTQVVSTGKIRGDDFYNDDEKKKVTISNYTLGLRLNMGLEYAVNIDWNVGVFAGLQVFPPLDWWTVKYGDEEIDVINDAWWTAPKFFSYSPTIGIYIHFSPPTLPFNPAAIVQNQMKKQGVL